MISIINYNAGNLRNVQKMFDLYECKTIITSLSDDIEKSTALILPGVGHFQDGMKIIISKYSPSYNENKINIFESKHKELSSMLGAIHLFKT